MEVLEIREIVLSKVMHDKLDQYRQTELAQEEQLFNAELSVTNMQVIVIVLGYPFSLVLVTDFMLLLRFNLTLPNNSRRSTFKWKRPSWMRSLQPQTMPGTGPSSTGTRRTP